MMPCHRAVEPLASLPVQPKALELVIGLPQEDFGHLPVPAKDLRPALRQHGSKSLVDLAEIVERGQEYDGLSSRRIEFFVFNQGFRDGRDIKHVVNCRMGRKALAGR
ncbi:hypothetical protein STA1M1_30140 [Sinisalibacter aestuarii]|uniref:Uncharacterized protein n=1 Tax=Sinisalibacter aestuarii TaxID=2949426 RepID=A0ABQ5LVX2_9RHOB|nr:hypothetical protein STA1M1_30140 [Sinisalibacter aestuarii]